MKYNNFSLMHFDYVTAAVAVATGYQQVRELYTT